MLLHLHPISLSLPLFSRTRQPDVSTSALSRRTRQSDQSSEPRGFGTATVYDTSLEDKLMNEIQRNTKKPVEDKVGSKKGVMKSNKGLGKGKGRDNSNTAASTSKTDAAPKGIRVRLLNLPKKKKIERDLQTAFTGFRGILQIDPAVSGNRKTRDPICKGFAFVDLASQQIADRFVETFSNKRISFGKIEKQINCCIVEKTSNLTPIFSNNSPKAPILERQLHEGFMGLSVKNKKDKKVAQVIFIDGNGDKNGTEKEAKKDKKDEILSKFEIIEVGDSDEEEEEEWDAEITKLPLKQKKGNVGVRKRKVRAKRKAKIPKLSMPLRLKGKERDVLTGVFTKYSGNYTSKSTNEG